MGVLAKPALVPWAAREAARKIEAYLLEHAVRRMLSEDEIKTLVEQGRTSHVAIKEDAANAGTKAHEVIDAYEKTMELPASYEDARVKSCVEAYLAWKKESQIKMVMGDTRILSLNHGYGGSIDGMGIDHDRLVVVDLKTSNGIWPEYFIQVSAYCHAFRETYNLPYVPDGLILHLDKKEAKFEAIEIKQPKLEKYFSVFLNCLSIYKAMKDL